MQEQYDIMGSPINMLLTHIGKGLIGLTEAMALLKGYYERIGIPVEKNGLSAWYYDYFCDLAQKEICSSKNMLEYLGEHFNGDNDEK